MTPKVGGGPHVFDDDAWMRPSARLVAVRRVEIGTTTVLFAAGFGWWGATDSLAVGTAVAAVLVALGLLWLWWAPRPVAAWAYAERHDDLLVRRGVLFSQLAVVPYARMQFVDVTAGPYERAFGLATVRLHTAAANSGARIPGLERADADRLRDRLVQRAEAHLAAL